MYLIEKGEIEIESVELAVNNYIHSVTDGVIKVLSKMGISTIQSYRGAQIFEAVGIHMDVIDKYFTRTSSRLGGIGIAMIEKEVLMRHEIAFGENRGDNQLGSWRRIPIPCERGRSSIQSEYDPYTSTCV
jgi:glutamate synthase (NADPH/NADH) large chain/glutamate synthase (ferredoxin)